MRIEKEIAFYKEKLQRDRAELDKYISEAPYPECDIIQFKVLNNMSWRTIGEVLGYSRWSVKRKYYDYIEVT